MQPHSKRVAGSILYLGPSVESLHAVAVHGSGFNRPLPLSVLEEAAIDNG